MDSEREQQLRLEALAASQRIDKFSTSDSVEAILVDAELIYQWLIGNRITEALEMKAGVYEEAQD